jgi:hypothetical protein
VPAADLRKKFLDICKANKQEYCLEVREMDNPAISLLHQEDFSSLLASYGGGAGNGDRLPLLVYRVYPADGHEEIIRGARITGLNTRVLRNVTAIGNDPYVFNYMQTQVAGFAGTALGTFGSAQNGLPSSVVAPSLLFEELDVPSRVGAEIFTTTHAYPERSVELHFFRCEMLGEPRPMLGQEMRWVHRDELAALEFPPADAELIRILTRS